MASRDAVDSTVNPAGRQADVPFTPPFFASGSALTRLVGCHGCSQCGWPAQTCQAEDAVIVVL